MGFKEIEWEPLDSTDMTKDRDKGPAVVNMVTNFRISWSMESFFTSLETIGFWRRDQLHGVSSLGGRQICIYIYI
jgi:hypothetical protein